MKNCDGSTEIYVCCSKNVDSRVVAFADEIVRKQNCIANHDLRCLYIVERGPRGQLPQLTKCLRTFHSVTRYLICWLRRRSRRGLIEGKYFYTRRKKNRRNFRILRNSFTFYPLNLQTLIIKPIRPRSIICLDQVQV